jgi:hypothetical protein
MACDGVWSVQTPAPFFDRVGAVCAHDATAHAQNENDTRKTAIKRESHQSMR